jgi:hypothetical protein
MLTEKHHGCRNAGIDIAGAIYTGALPWILCCCGKLTGVTQFWIVMRWPTSSA